VVQARFHITLPISVVQKHPPRSEEAPLPLLSSTKVVMPLLMPNWLQWMSIIFLMVGMHPIPTLLPPVIRGHLVLPQILTHAIRRDFVARLLLTTRITVVLLVLGLCPLHPPFMLVDLVHRPIMAILPAGFQFLQALQAPIALLMHTLGSQLVMDHQALEKLVGNVVSGNGVGSQVDGMLGQHISMSRLRHLEP